jgi:hypothetical protein
MMRSIEQTHGGQVKLTVSPAGIGGTGGLAMVISFEVVSVAAAGGAEQTLVVNRWPCPMHRDWWSCVFEGLYRLDAKIARDYFQTSLTDSEATPLT